MPGLPTHLVQELNVGTEWMHHLADSSGSIDKTERVFRHSGVVDMFDVYALEKKERNVMVQFHGDRDFGRFGQEVKVIVYTFNDIDYCSVKLSELYI